MRCKVLVLALALLAATVPAVALADAHVEQEAREIAKLLQCPVCQNLSVADSPSPLATQMRGLIREQLAAGQSREAILDYFVTRYGEEILLDPPKTGFNQFLWWGAAAIPLGGLILVVLHLRSWVRPRRAAPLASTLPDAEWQEYEALLERELDHPERGRL